MPAPAAGAGGAPAGLSDVAVVVQARGDVALFLAQPGAFAGLGIEHAAPDFGTAIAEQAADALLRQRVAFIADHAAAGMAVAGIMHTRPARRWRWWSRRSGRGPGQAGARRG